MQTSVPQQSGLEYNPFIGGIEDEQPKNKSDSQWTPDFVRHRESDMGLDSGLLDNKQDQSEQPGPCG